MRSNVKTQRGNVPCQEFARCRGLCRAAPQPRLNSAHTDVRFHTQGVLANHTRRRIIWNYNAIWLIRIMFGQCTRRPDVRNDVLPFPAQRPLRGFAVRFSPFYHRVHSRTFLHGLFIVFANQRSQAFGLPVRSRKRPLRGNRLVLSYRSTS